MYAQQPMVPEDVAAAWRFFLANWIVAGAMGAVLALSLIVANFSVELSGLAIAVGYVGLYSGFAHANACPPTRRDPQMMFVLGGTAQIILMTAVITPLINVAVATNLPLQDGSLLAIDRSLGFGQAAYVGFITDHPALAGLLAYGQVMIHWPILVIPVILATTRRYQRIEEFIFAFGVALIATAMLFALVPTLAVYQHHLTLLGLGGIVTFPIFHAASAVLDAWALWTVRWLRPLLILVNGFVLAAAPLNGGHGFIDLTLGVAIAAAAIGAARVTGSILARRQYVPRQIASERAGLALLRSLPVIAPGRHGGQSAVQ